MRVCSALVAALVAATVSSSARADGLLYKLPKDGTWATYEMEASAKFGSETIRGKGTVRMASVGQVVEDGQPCRWIEVGSEAEVRAGEGEKAKVRVEKEAWKVLIPEKFLARGQAPVDQVIRGWQRGDKAEVRKLEDPKDIDKSPLPVFLPGPLKNAKNLPAAPVESKLGKRLCAGESGTFELKAWPERTWKCALETRLHADAPFGVVCSNWKIEMTGAVVGTMHWKMKLIDFGDNAKSAMPDAK